MGTSLSKWHLSLISEALRNMFIVFIIKEEQEKTKDEQQIWPSWLFDSKEEGNKQKEKISNRNIIVAKKLIKHSNYIAR